MADDDDVEESTSSDSTLRCYGPPVLAIPYRHAQSGLGDNRAVLARRIAFVDATLRYLFAVMAAELVGLGLSPKSQTVALVSKLDNPSMGAWKNAVLELGRTLTEHWDHLVAPELLGVVYQLPRRGSAELTDAARALEIVVQCRNDIAHADGGINASEEEARNLLDTVVKSPLVALVSALRVVRQYPLLYIASQDERQDGSRPAEILRFIGVEIDPVRLDARQIRLPLRTPFLLSRSGNALLLSPWLRIAEFRGERVVEARLLCDWDKEASYSDPRGGSPSTAAAPDLGPPLTWLDQSTAFARRDNCVPDSQLGDLIGMRDTAAPRSNDFTVEGVLGRGTSGTVYLARMQAATTPLGQRVALKVLRTVIAQDPLQQRRLRSEHHVLSQLEHPAIVKVFDYCEGPAGPYLVMEWVNGIDLETELQRGPLPVGRAVEICRQVLSALAAAHGKGVIHRDVKPSNVLIDSAGSVRLIDFGIALAESLARATRTMDAVGTTTFAAPEQLQLREVSPRSDIYSVGRMLDYLISGTHAATSESLPPGIRAIIRKATQPDPAHRFQTATEMLAALDDRRQVGWGGAAVEAGDHLLDSYELRKLENRVADGLWVFAAREIATGEPVGLVLADTPETRAELDAAVASCKPAVRKKIGYRGSLRTGDGLSFVVFDGDNPMEAALGLLPQRRARPQGTAPGPSLLLDVQDPDSLPIYLRELTHVALVDALDLFSTAELWGHILAAQLQARSGADPDIDVWSEISRQVFAFLEKALLATNVPESAKRVRESIRRIRHSRNDLVHAGIAGDAKQQANASDLRAMFDLSAELGAQVHPRRLWPFIHQLDGAWGVLVDDGVPRYALLSAGGGYADLPAEVVAAIARMPGSVANVAIEQARASLRDDIFARVFQELGDGKWHIVEGMRRDVILYVGGIPMRSDLVLVDTTGSILAVVEFLLHRSTRGREQLLENLWLRAIAAKAGFVALTDGTTWTWYQVDEQQGLLEVDGLDEIEEIQFNSLLVDRPRVDISAQRAERIIARCQRAFELEASDPERAVAEARTAAEMICRAIARRELSEFTATRKGRTRLATMDLASLVEVLKRAGKIPAALEVPFQVLERSSSQPDLLQRTDELSTKNVMTSAHSQPPLAALTAIRDWYTPPAPGSPQTWRVHSSVIFSLRDREDSESPSATEAAMHLAKANMLRGHDRKAAAEEYRMAAKAYETAGNLAAAVEALSTLLELFPVDRAARIARGEYLVSMNRINDGVEDMLAAADTLMKNKRIDDYIKVVERVVWLNSSDPAPARELATVYLAMGDATRALRSIQIAFRADPRSLGTLEVLAKVFEQLGSLPKAAAVWSELEGLHLESGNAFGAEKARARASKLRAVPRDDT